MKIDHKALGNVEVLLEFQHRVYGEDQPKYLGLVKSYTQVDYEGGSYRRSWITGSSGRELKPIYYMLWSNTPDLHLAGWTELRTPSGRKQSLGGALKLFNKATKALDHIEFNKV